MIYTKYQFGKELEKRIQLKYDVQKLSNWAYSVYIEHCNVFEPGLKDIVMDIVTMGEGKEFELSKNELIAIVRKLVLSASNFETNKSTSVIDNKINSNLYIKEEIFKFINEIYILGICIHDSESFNYLLSKEYYEVNDFVTEVFYLASISPETNLSLFRDAKKEFIDKFGCSEIWIKK
jgi:hypothetical protein